MPDNLAGQTIGPLITSRWLTCAVRVCCRYTRTNRPSKALIRLTRVALNLYFPGWFIFKQFPHIQQVARNFFHVMELTKDLEKEDMAIAEKVLQDNRKAVLQIMKARREFDATNHPRKFIPPRVNFQVCL